MTHSSKARAKSGSKSATAREKVEHPDKSYSDPAQVVADGSLSMRDKITALDTLEQDARQLATASAEGMSGGEESELRNVLQAKRMLEPPSTDVAFGVILRTFENWLRDKPGTAAHAAVARAIVSIEAAREAMAQEAGMAAPAPGAARPGSAQELEEELAKEKLDP